MRDPLLNMILEDQESAPELYKATPFWKDFAQPILDDIDNYGIDAFRSHPSATLLYVPYYGNLEWLRNPAQFDSLLNSLPDAPAGVRKAVQGFLDGSTNALNDYKIVVGADQPDKSPQFHEVNGSDCGQPLEHIQYDGRTLSCSMLNYMRMLCLLKQNAETECIQDVLEIGGGFGALGEIFLKSPSKDYFYIDVDIPPVVYIATRYLQSVFGEENVASYDKTRDMDEIYIDELRSKYKCAVLCSWQLPKLRGNVDLFMNSISFQEMEPEVVNNYAQLVSGLTRHYLLLRNQRHGKPVRQKEGDVGVVKPTTREDYVKFFDGFDRIALNSRSFGSISDTGHHSEVSVWKKRG